MSGPAGFCGVDVGTQGVRAAVIDGAGHVIGRGSDTLVGRRFDDGRHEQQPEDWWTAVVVAVRAAVTAARAASPDVVVAALALDATSGTVLVEAADGRPGGPALMYDDARAGGQLARAQETGAELWSALGYRMQRSWGLPKAMWLVEAGLVGRAGHVVHQSDHLVRRLVGHRVPTDTSNALKTGADLRTASWPEDVLAELGLAPGVLPDLVRPGTPVGTISPDVARATGLSTDTVVRAGMTDGCAAQIAAGALAPGSWSSTLGTTLVIKGSTEALLRDPSGAVYSHRHPDGGWLPGGASSSGAGVFASLLPGRDLDHLTALAAQRPDDVGQTPYPLAGTGERFPFVHHDARGFGPGFDTGTHPPATADDATDAQVFAALCRGIAYVERLAYDVLRALGADVSGPVALTGRPTGNTWFNQLRTDVLQRPTALPESADAAVGMAVLAAAAPDELTATAERMVHMHTRLEPDPDRAAALDDGYRRFVDALTDRSWLAPAVADAVLTGASGRAR